MDNNKCMVGVGLRSSHYPVLEENQATQVDWFEAISENYMNTEGRPLKMLMQIRQSYPMALHGVGLSIASHDEISKIYLKKLKALIERIEPLVVSDHFCWSSIGGHYSHDLLPFPFTNESLQTVVKHVNVVQDFLKRQICLENISYYLKSKDDEMEEFEFINQVCKNTGCGLLLDLNNIDVNAQNHGFDSFNFLNAINLSYVQQLHLAGPSQEKDFIFDTHSSPVPDSVWNLYRQFVSMKKTTPVIIEWDENIPSFNILEDEVNKVRQI